MKQLQKILSIVVCIGLMLSLSACFKKGGDGSSRPSNGFTNNGGKDESSEVQSSGDVSSEVATSSETSAEGLSIEDQLKCFADNADIWMKEGMDYSFQMSDMDGNGRLEIMCAYNEWDFDSETVFDTHYNRFYEVNEDCSGIKLLTYSPDVDEVRAPNLMEVWESYIDEQGTIIWVWHEYEYFTEAEYNGYLNTMYKDGDKLCAYTLAYFGYTYETDYYYYDGDFNAISQDAYSVLQRNHFADYQVGATQYSWESNYDNQDAETFVQLLYNKYQLNFEELEGEDSKPYYSPTEEDSIISLARVMAGWSAYSEDDAVLETENFYPALVNAITLNELRFGGNVAENGLITLDSETYYNYIYTIFPYAFVPEIEEEWLTMTGGTVEMYAYLMYDETNTEVLSIEENAYGGVDVTVETLDYTNTTSVVHLEWLDTISSFGWIITDIHTARG